MLDVKDSIRKEGSTYIFKCSECPREIKSKSDYLTKHSGKCIKCSHKKPPFYHIYKRLRNAGKQENKEVNITYDDFLKFTTDTSCHYCLSDIPWIPYCYVDNGYINGAYYLDRKDNTQGYIVNNLVVCCTKCNKAKGDRYTYEEWYGMTKYLRNKK